jgi:ComF family protein
MEAAKIWEWIYPPKCIFCESLLSEDEKPNRVCGACRTSLPLVKGLVCLKCGKGLMEETEEYCPDCRERRHAYEYGKALFHYTEEVKGMIARFKYKNQRSIGVWLGGQIAETFHREIIRMQADMLTPVPLYIRKERQRGFNQARILAETVGRKAGLPSEDLLIRRKSTRAQKDLGADARAANLAGSFQIAEAWRDRLPEAVILVDDIYTTGSTIDACAAELKRGGVKRVYFLAAAIGRCR